MARTPEWLSKAVFYEIYPQSYYDSNGDGIGDIPGIIQKLDYIQWLGCNAIWMNPCFDSPFRDAGYDISNYYNIAPRYGTNRDAKRLFKEAAGRGIRICLDLVPCHTSIDHEWFRQSCKHDRNEYTDRYIWNLDPKSESGFIWGYAERFESYYASFFWSQPALNFGYASPDPKKPWQMSTDSAAAVKSRHAIMDVMRFWLDMGASGFRVDMAGSIVKNDPDSKYTCRFWQQVRAMLDKEYPETVLVSEWANPPKSIKAGFHCDFILPIVHPAYATLFRNKPGPDWHHRDNHSYFRKAGRGDICEFLNVYLDHLTQTKRKGYLSFVTGNHDMPRISVGRTDKGLEVALAFILTMPGVPFIYYGDEIAMKYQKHLPSKEGGFGRTGSRTPMQWTNSRNAGFSKAPANKLYLPVQKGKSIPNVKSQYDKSSSLLNRVRRLIELRISSPALGADGSFKPLYARKNKYPFVYLRSRAGSRYIVVVNPSGKAVEAGFELNAPVKNHSELLAGRGVKLDCRGRRCKITAPGVSYAVFRLPK